VPVTLAEAYSKAQARTEGARQALEASTVFKDYQLALSQEQSQLLFAMGEVGAKPSECKPVLKEGRLDHFECSPPEVKKDLPAKP
jgi:hypothetical protein